jgi:hypothetical protein
MKINVNHPAFVTFLDTVNSNILNNVNPEKYFSLSLQYLTLKMINQSVKVRAKLTDGELYEFTEILRNKGVESENYEFAGVLNDILTNFDVLNEMTKTGRRQKRVVKTDKTTNE